VGQRERSDVTPPLWISGSKSPPAIQAPEMKEMKGQTRSNKIAH
jgi:hypothetical protein